MSRKAPGKSHRKGLSLIQLLDMFPNEKAAVKWLKVNEFTSIAVCVFGIGA